MAYATTSHQVKLIIRNWNPKATSILMWPEAMALTLVAKHSQTFQGATCMLFTCSQASPDGMVLFPVTVFMSAYWGVPGLTVFSSLACLLSSLDGYRASRPSLWLSSSTTVEVTKVVYITHNIGLVNAASIRGRQEKGAVMHAISALKCGSARSTQGAQRHTLRTDVGTLICDQPVLEYRVHECTQIRLITD